jgi:integrase
VCPGFDGVGSWTGSTSSDVSSRSTASSSPCRTGRPTLRRRRRRHPCGWSHSPQVVVDALAAHLATWPAEDFVFTTELGELIRRTAFSERVWRPAVRRAGLSGVTMHSLRHFYASLLIRHGESVKTVQARLGHASAAETLDTYSHLWPDSDDRTRAAVDFVLGQLADSVRTDVAL